ncbi:MAG TPA: LysM domain-containing protein, partial [Limnochordia bacterium]
MSRMPTTCPSGCQGGRHTVQAGETIFSIARQRGISLEALIACNPHIPNPDVIFAGDVLCLPDGEPPEVRLPCCLILR